MSAAEAIKALKEKFGPMAAIKPQASPSTFGYGSYSKTLNYTLGNMTINIQFVEYMPLDQEHREAAWAIEYKLEKPTRAEHAAFNAALQAKYGPVSSFADPFTPRGLYPGLLMHWRQCPHLESGPNNLDLLNRDYIAWEGSFSVPTRQGRLPP